METRELTGLVVVPKSNPTATERFFVVRIRSIISQRVEPYRVYSEQDGRESSKKAMPRGLKDGGFSDAESNPKAEEYQQRAGKKRESPSPRKELLVGERA
jgi:hypothetical protein